MLKGQKRAWADGFHFAVKDGHGYITYFSTYTDASVFARSRSEYPSSGGVTFVIELMSQTKSEHLRAYSWGH